MNLPKVFQNKNLGNISNDQQYYYSSSKNVKNVNPIRKANIQDKINNIFKSNKFSYKINVIISTIEKDIDTTIIGKVNNKLITINNELIPINDIIDIKEK